MSKRTRAWIGTTLLAILLLNYLVIAVPLYKRMNSLEVKIKAMIIKQVKSGNILKNTEDNYIIDVLKKETIAIDRKIVITNSIAATAAIAIISWLLFGLIAYRDERKRNEAGPK